jgi:glycerol transport system ATP-binding protein
MDEPLVNIDYKLREELAGELKSLVSGTRTCLVYSTSDPRDALSLGDFVMLLRDREVLQVGKPLDVYRYPQSFEAADLLSDPGINRISANEVVRPEHISLDPREGLSFAASISGVETNGAETYLHAVIGQNNWVVKLKGMKDVHTGDQVTFYVKSADVLKFESHDRTGASLG